MLTIVIKLYIISLVLIYLITVGFVVPLTNAPSLHALPLVTANLISF